MKMTKKLKEKTKSLTNWDDFIVEQFQKDEEFAKMSIKDELQEFHKTGEIKYLIKTINAASKAFGINNLEKKVGISRQAIHAIISEKSMPKFDTALLILRALGYQLNITFKKNKNAKI